VRQTEGDLLCELSPIGRSICGPAAHRLLVGRDRCNVGIDSTRFVIKGTIVTPEKVMEGEVVIEGDTITCVAASCTDPPGGVAH
jgi:hypothetical protein